MAALSYFERQSLTHETELEEIGDLQNLCITFDDLDGGTSAAELREEFDDPTFDPEQDLQLWRDRDGNLRAVATLWRPTPGDHIEGYLHFSIHPEARNQGLERDVLAWGEQRLRQVAEGSVLPIQIQMGCRDTLSDRIALYEQFGCLPVRYFFRMRRSLTDPIPDPQLPEGFTLRHVDPDGDAAAWVEMFNQSFIDHWNHHPMTLEEYRYYTRLSDYDPTMDLVAVAPDGTLAAFCYARCNTVENERNGRREGWINVLGTRRGFRRQGLGRAMLLAGLQRLAIANLDTALLGVDANNPSGALGLYQSVGFEAFRRFIVFSKAV